MKDWMSSKVSILSCGRLRAWRLGNVRRASAVIDSGSRRWEANCFARQVITAPFVGDVVKWMVCSS